MDADSAWTEADGLVFHRKFNWLAPEPPPQRVQFEIQGRFPKPVGMTLNGHAMIVPDSVLTDGNCRFCIETATDDAQLLPMLHSGNELTIKFDVPEIVHFRNSDSDLPMHTSVSLQIFELAVVPTKQDETTLFGPLCSGFTVQEC